MVATSAGAAEMTCKTCLERRRETMQAWQQKKIAEAVRQAALGAGDMIRKVIKDGK